MMAWTITPDNFDVAMIGSGLPECLVAASLVKSGKSVLIIDAVDTYGTDFASFTPAALQDALAQQQQQHLQQHLPAAPSPGLPAADDDAASPTQENTTPPQTPRSEEHEHSLPAQCSLVSEPLPPGCRLLRMRQRALPLYGIRAMAAPGEGGGPDDRRSYILDLAPKLVYQSEPLVDLLVHCRCHHYLEFKAVDGNYILQDGALQPVPGGRADIFRDRRLSLADKRALMRFIQGCVEARAGRGHLQEALSSSSRPLADILAAEGLSQRLREMILYGIAMCDTDQEPPPPQQQQPEPAAEPSVADVAGGIVMGAAGGAALELFTASAGRFGHGGAFMLPSYGSGSVAEAVVRLGAVHGAVTVLRQPVQALVVAAEEEPEPSPKMVGGAAAAAEAAAAPAAEPIDGETAAESSEGATATAAALEGSECGASGGGVAAGRPGPRVVAIVTAGGQVVRCGAVVAGGSTLSCLQGAAPPPCTSMEFVSRAVAVLDGPLQLPPPPPPAQQQPQARAESLLTLVVPPRCPGLAAAAAAPAGGAGPADNLRSSSVGSGSGPGIGNPHPVRGLQEGPSTCVCPPGSFLLYLSTPATSASSYDDLFPALDCLVDTSQLQDVATCPPPSSSSSSSSLPAASAAATSTSASSPSSPAVPQPRALRAWFYRQPVSHPHHWQRGGRGHVSGGPALGGNGCGAAVAAAVGALPGGVIWLPGPDGSLAGYSRVLGATEEAFRAAFPGAKWLSELDFRPQAEAAGGDEEGGSDGDAVGGDGGSVSDDGEDDDAINELTAAVARLKDA